MKIAGTLLSVPSDHLLLPGSFVTHHNRCEHVQTLMAYSGKQRAINTGALPLTARKLLLLLITLVSVALLLEAAARLYVDTYKNRSIAYDANLGWRSRANYIHVGEYIDANGNPYPVEFSTDQNGFRTFGSLDTAKQKVLIVGDSFTHAVEVSNKATYHSVLAGSGKFEVFAYGTRGYGTLQELLILQEWAGVIDPDTVILQFCPNDFINNSLALESQSYENRNNMQRPYLGPDHSVHHATPNGLSPVRVFALKHSRLLHFIISRIDQRISSSKRHRTVERRIEETWGTHSEYMRAVQVTGHLFRQLADATSGAHVLAFTVSTQEPYYRDFKRLLSECGIREIPGVANALSHAHSQGLIVHCADGAHWSEQGHRIAASVIDRHLRDHGGTYHNQPRSKSSPLTSTDSAKQIPR